MLPIEHILIAVHVHTETVHVHAATVHVHTLHTVLLYMHKPYVVTVHVHI